MSADGRADADGRVEEDGRIDEDERADVGRTAADYDPAALPVGAVVELTPPAAVAKAAFDRVRAAARARGARPGQPAPGWGRSGADADVTGGRGAAGAHWRDPQAMGSVLGRIVTERGWNEPLRGAGLVERWREVVGDDVADNTTPETLTDGVLVVRAGSTAWATNLGLMRGQLLTRLAEVFGEGVVSEVQVLGPVGRSFKRGPRSVPGRGPRDTYG